MSQKQYSSITLLMLVGCLFSACGGKSDGSSSAGSVDSGLPGAQKLSTLTADEITKLEKAIASYAKTRMADLSKADLCNFAGTMAAGFSSAFGSETTDAQLQSVCVEAEDLCNSNASTSENTTSSTTGNPTDPSTYAACPATVNEYQTCATDSIDALVTSIQSLPECAELTSAAFTPSTANETTPSSCVAINEKCPNLINSTS
jgi:hypothetical protein